MTMLQKHYLRALTPWLVAIACLLLINKPRSASVTRHSAMNAFVVDAHP